MKKLSKRFNVLVLALIIGGFSISTIVFADELGINKTNYKVIALASDNNVNKMSDKTISDIHKIWTIRFNSSIDANSFSSGIQVKDLTDGITQQTSSVIGDDDSSIKINPPSQGYKVGHSYEISVDKNIKSKKGNNLNRSGLMSFKVIDVNSGNYTASVKVVVSPVLSALKQIVINSLNLTDVKTIKVSGSDRVFNMGETIVSATNQNTITLYFYSGDGKTIIAKGTVDVSQSRDNVTIKLTNEN